MDGCLNMVHRFHFGKEFLILSEDFTHISKFFYFGN